MSKKYSQYFNTRQIPQNQPIPGRDMVPNSAGGYTFAVDDWIRLDRFLILGSEASSYYASAQKLTIQNAEAVVRCIEENGVRVVKRITEISQAGRAPKNDPALFVLALCSKFGDLATKHAAFDAFGQIVRIGTHLFKFNEEVKAFRGRGRWLRRVNTAWYNTMPPDKLAYQAIKYQQREGWSHRDVLRLTKPVPPDTKHQAIYRWITKGELIDNAPKILEGTDKIRHLTTEKREAAQLIQEYKLPREVVPTELLNYPEVWEALLVDMPMTAMIRNLATMTRVGLIKPLSDAARLIQDRITNQKALTRARIHPIAVLSALKTYAQGRGERGKHQWQPVQSIVEALDDAFYLAFKNVEPTNKRWILAVDVSGSMDWAMISSVPGLTPRVAAGAMAMITAKTEQQHVITAFSGQMRQVNLSAKKRLDDVLKTFEQIPMGRTDCALPMIWALKERSKADVFVIYTDNETWCGNIHPIQALENYRREMGINAKLIVVGMISNQFTIADPNDAGTLDVVGFDTATPALMADFVSQ
ncbi:MAG: TROVE domain-containing protein [Candidatus Parabeggiatoa sp. nov. 3]|nr:MAG: TROVE domain-containing protein [Gammaproteobacteria bacterium]RKZ74929.1 MAG: TROVE domain-containing protein [Gammaproteobacteria bacterium]